jgi:hypothetical protein
MLSHFSALQYLETGTLFVNFRNRSQFHQIIAISDVDALGMVKFIIALGGGHLVAIR